MKSLYVITLLSIVAGISLHAADDVEQVTHAIQRRDRERVLQLVNPNNINIMHKFGTYLHYAINEDADDIAIDLIERGADINAQTIIYNHTPLHYAAYLNKLIIVQKLLQYGSHKDTLNKAKNTPAQLAKQRSFHEIAQLINDYEYIEDIKEPEHK